ncbi:4Fe-4S binding protein [Neobacillus citreus]|uniref:4Fe-4S binding protein n=1 Tax=Neobacillus citreus TaxID=2833578 RepID=A0A942T418_9BACI|nr:4Fe-4S binding protein [Neobacillus citreus]MCH6267641.1 4Fe-4S binding protein [Neobacillus citreus]
MNLMTWAKAIEKNTTTLMIEANLCTRLISPKSTCRQCVDSCPTNCITFTKDTLEITDSCLECGLCTTVCPTSALSSNRHSLHHLVETVLHTCKESEHVYLHCQRHSIKEECVAAVAVPCLGSIPREAWLTFLEECDNLSIHLPDGGCDRCEIKQGEELWQRELAAAERMSGKCMDLALALKKSTELEGLDKSKRSLFHSIWREWKDVHKLAVKETLGCAEIKPYQEKLKSDSASLIRKEWNVAANGVMEKVFKESTYPYMVKRNLFLNQLIKNKDLQTEKNVRVPMILSDCTLCGACSILCPTNALVQETENGATQIKLIPANCVDCKLCEEICYFKQIQLIEAENRVLLKGQGRESVLFRTESQ